MQLLQFKFDSPMESNLCQIFPLHFAVERCDSLLHLALEIQILPLQNAAGSQILPLYDAAGSQILLLNDAAWSQSGSRESSLKNFGRRPRPLMGLSCKKSHMGDLHYSIPTRIIY